MVLLVHLDRLVDLAGEETAATHIERGCADASLAVQRAGLHDTVHLLEAIASAVVPKTQGAVVT